MLFDECSLEKSDNVDDNLHQNVNDDETKMQTQSESDSISSMEETDEADMIAEPTFHEDTLELYLKDSQSDYSELDEETDDEEMINGLKRSVDKISRIFEKNKSGWRQLKNTLMLEGKGFCILPFNTLNPDKSENNLFEWRLTELRDMCSNLIRPQYILDSMEATKQEYAMVSLQPCLCIYAIPYCSL